MIRPESILQRNSNMLTSEVGGELVMMSIEEGKYFGSNKIGSYIWRLLDQPTRFDDLCGQLAETFRIDIDICVNDVKPFIQELQNVKIINIQ